MFCANQKFEKYSVSLILLTILSACSPFSTKPFYQPGVNTDEVATVVGEFPNLDEFGYIKGPRIGQKVYFELTGHDTKRLDTAYVIPGKHCVVVYTYGWSESKDVLLPDGWIEVSSDEICFEATRGLIYQVGLETQEPWSAKREDYSFYVRETGGRIIY